MVESRTERVAARIVSVAIFALIWSLAFPESQALGIVSECARAAGHVGAAAIRLAWFTVRELL